MAGPVIDGGRVRLTPLAVEDAREMAGVLSGPELYSFTGGEPPTEPELRARYARQVAGASADGTQQWRNWIIRRVPDGVAVGYVQATITDGGTRATVGWVVGLAWQGRGYARDAARAMADWLAGQGVTTVEAWIHPAHAASAAVARAIGLCPAARVRHGEQLWTSSSPQG